MEEEQAQPREFAYNAFASHATDPDSAVVRDIERFLESLHENPLIPQKYRVKLELCVDGSDFKIARSQRGSTSAAVREILIGYMRQCRYFVLFAGPKSAGHEWVNFEVEWWLLNRGAESILLAVTHGEEKTTFFPTSVVTAGLHHSIWFDLRGYGRAARGVGRPYQEERLRLAGALLDAAPAELLAGWRLEAARARRDRAIVRACVTVALAVLLVVAGFALRRWHDNARQARATEWALISEQVAAPQANRSLDRLAYALASFREHQTAHSFAALQQAMAPLPVAAGSFRLPGGKGIEAIRFLEHDQLLLTISLDGTAQLTSTATRTAASRVQLSGRAFAVASDPEQPMLAIGTSRGLDLVEYTKTTAHVVAHLEGGSPVRAVVFDPKGGAVYTGDFDGNVVEYSRKDRAWTARRRLVMLDHIGARVGIVGFAPSWATRRIEIVGIEGDRCTLDIAAWNVTCDRQQHGRIHALAGSSLSDIAVVAEADGGVRVFRAASGDIACIPPPPADTKQVATGVSLSADGGRVGVTAHDGTVRIYAVSNQRLLNVVVGDVAARSVAFSESATLLAAGSDAGDVTLWNIGGNTAAWSVNGALAAAADPTRRRVVLLTANSLQIRDAQTGSLLGGMPITDVPRSVRHFALTRDGNAVAALFERSDRVLVWRIDGSPRGPAILQHANEPGHVAVVSSIVPGPGPTQLVTTESFQSRAASLWDAAQARLIARIPMGDEVFRAATGNDCMAVADRSGVVRLLRVSTGKVIAAFRVGGIPSVLAIDRDARTLFISWGRRSCIYDLDARLSCRSVALDGTPEQAIFSPSGRRLAIALGGGIRDGRVLVADREKRWEMHPLQTTVLVHQLAFSTDESWIAAAHDQRGVSVFATQDGEQAAEIAVGAQLTRVAIMPDTSRTLVTLTDDGSLQGWRWERAEFVQAACSRWPAGYVPTQLPGAATIPSRDQLCKPGE